MNAQRADAHDGNGGPMHDMMSDQGLREFFDESPDRAIGVSLPAMLEHSIEQMLRRSLRDDDSGLAGELLKPSGPLGAFGTKVRISYMLCLFDKDVYADLLGIEEIRNLFAHRLAVKTFDHDAVRA